MGIAKAAVAPKNIQPPANAAAVARHPKALFGLARDSITAWLDDFAPSMGAAISYYTIFSIAPLLLIAIAIAGIAFGADAAAGRIYSELADILGSEGARAVQAMVESASKPEHSVAGTIVGVATLLIGSTTAFAELQSALDRIWRAPAAAKAEGIFALLRARFLSFGLVLTIGFLLLVSLIVSVALSTLGTLWAPYLASWEILLQMLNAVVSLGIVTVLFAAIYKWLPRAPIAWRDVWIGAVVTAVLFTLGKLLIGLYIGKSGVVSGFGAAASIVVVMLWVYYSAQIFLLGAEFTWLYAYRFGSRRGQQPGEPAAARADAAGHRLGNAADAGTSTPRAGPARFADGAKAPSRRAPTSAAAVAESGRARAAAGVTPTQVPRIALAGLAAFGAGYAVAALIGGSAAWSRHG